MVRTPSNTRHRAAIRLATVDDINDIVTLEREIWGEAAANHHQISQRIANVPYGNIVAVHPDGRICGYTAFCMLNYDEYARQGHCSWYDLSGKGTASTHVPGASDLFGINLGVTPWAPKDTSMRLLGEVVREGIRARGRRGILGARMPGFHKYADRMPAHEYWKVERKPGILLDPELRFYCKFGMKPVRLVEDYFEDADSLNWGVLVEMRVPWVVSVFGPVLARLPVDIMAILEKIG